MHLLYVNCITYSELCTYLTIYIYYLFGALLIGIGAMNTQIDAAGRLMQRCFHVTLIFMIGLRERTVVIF